jgi:hypothetical protein
MPRVNRPDAGEQHFRSVRRTHDDLDVTELAPAALQVQRQAVERHVGPDGGARRRVTSSTRGSMSMRMPLNGTVRMVHALGMQMAHLALPQTSATVGRSVFGVK